MARAAATPTIVKGKEKLFTKKVARGSHDQGRGSGASWSSKQRWGGEGRKKLNHKKTRKFFAHEYNLGRHPRARYNENPSGKQKKLGGVFCGREGALVREMGPRKGRSKRLPSQKRGAMFWRGKM